MEHLKTGFDQGIASRPATGWTLRVDPPIALVVGVRRLTMQSSHHSPLAVRIVPSARMLREFGGRPFC